MQDEMTLIRLITVIIRLSFAESKGESRDSMRPKKDEEEMKEGGEGSGGGGIGDVEWVKRSCRVRRLGSSQLFSPLRSRGQCASCGFSRFVQFIHGAYA